MIFLRFSMRISVWRYRCPPIHGRWMSENSPYLVFHDDFSLFFNENFSMKLQLPYQGLLFNENFSVTLPLPLIYGRSRLKKHFMMILLWPPMNRWVTVTSYWNTHWKTNWNHHEIPNMGYFQTFSAWIGRATVTSHWNVHWKAKKNYHEMLAIFKPWAPMNRGATITSKWNFHSKAK